MAKFKMYDKVRVIDTEIVGIVRWYTSDNEYLLRGPNRGPLIGWYEEEQLESYVPPESNKGEV